MKSRPEKGNAPVVGATEASSEKSQTAKKGTIEMNSTALTIAGVSVRQHNSLFSLNDLHRASGGAEKHEPNQFTRLEQTQALIAEIKSADQRNCIETRRGKQGGTYACKELVIAYAAWISAAFHLKVIRVFLATMGPQREADPAIDYTRISPAQAQDLREIVQAIVDAKIQGHAETWARFHNKFRVNSYLQLPASRHLEARQYLISKLPAGYAGEVVQEKPAMSQQDTEQAFTLATQAAAKVSSTVFNGILSGNEDWKRSRFVVSLDTDPRSNELVVRAKQLEYNACVLPIDKFHLAIEDGIAIDPQVLMRLATTCMNKMASMAQQGRRALA